MCLIWLYKASWRCEKELRIENARAERVFIIPDGYLDKWGAFYHWGSWEVAWDLAKIEMDLRTFPFGVIIETLVKKSGCFATPLIRNQKGRRGFDEWTEKAI